MVACIRLLPLSVGCRNAVGYHSCLRVIRQTVQTNASQILLATAARSASLFSSPSRLGKSDLPPWLPYRFPRGRLSSATSASAMQPWLPYRFPRGRLLVGDVAASSRGRGFPTDFPVVGLNGGGDQSAVASLPISPW